MAMTVTCPDCGTSHTVTRPDIVARKWRRQCRVCHPPDRDPAPSVCAECDRPLRPGGHPLCARCRGLAA